MKLGDGCSAMIETTDYQLAFDGSGAHMPTSLTFKFGNGSNVFAAAADGIDGMGIALAGSDAQIAINSVSGGFVGSGHVDVLMNGSAAIELEVSGNVVSGCNVSDTWVTDFTAYPDGRIARFDKLSGGSANGTSFGSCTLTRSYITLDATSTVLSRLSLHGQTSGEHAPRQPFAATGPYVACFSNGSDDAPAAHVAVGFAHAVGDADSNITFYQTEGEDVALRLSQDWIDTVDGATADTYLVGVSDQTLEIDAHNGCDALQSASYLLPLGSNSTFAADYGRGLYTGEWTPGMQMDGPLPAGWAVEIRAGLGIARSRASDARQHDAAPRHRLRNGRRTGRQLRVVVRGAAAEQRHRHVSDAVTRVRSVRTRARSRRRRSVRCRPRCARSAARVPTNMR